VTAALRRATRPRSTRTDARHLPAVAACVSRLVRSGVPLPDALADAGRTVAPAGSSLADELGEVAAAVERGWTVEDALERWRGRCDDPAVDLVVTACRLGHVHGGDLPGALDGAALMLSDRVDVEDEARALATQARSSAAVLVALPVVGAAGFALLDPGVGRTLLGTPLGWACLVVGGALDAAGALALRHLVRRALR